MDLWDQLRIHTQARIGLHRSGHSISTKELLEFQQAHAIARDAVYEPWDVKLIEKELKHLGEKPIVVQTSVNSRDLYLKFPQLGAVLNLRSYKKLIRYRKTHHVDIVFIITDGLSSRAITAHFLPFWQSLKSQMPDNIKKLKIAIVLAPFGRVALSDDIGRAMGARMSVICVGERPGLSSSDSLGIYLTYSPKPGNSNAERNCISNIHPPEGLDYESGAEKLLYLMRESLKLHLSGITIKEKVCHLFLSD